MTVGIQRVNSRGKNNLKYELISDVLPISSKYILFAWSVKMELGPLISPLLVGMRLSSVIAEVKSFAFWFWCANLEASSTTPGTWALQFSAPLCTGVNNIHWPTADRHLPQAFSVGRFQWDIFKGTAFTLDSGLLESFTRRISCKFHPCHTASSFGGPWAWPHWGVDLNPRGSLYLGCPVSALEIVALSYNSCFDTL